mgnify:CR=1 FL=1
MTVNSPTPRALRRKAMADAYYATVAGKPTTHKMAGYFLEQKLAELGYRVIQMNRRNADYREEPTKENSRVGSGVAEVVRGVDGPSGAAAIR